MALLDFVAYNEATFGLPASQPQQVASGTTASIKPGEPVTKALGAQYVALMATNEPVVGTDYLAGIAATYSDETTTADGTVQVIDLFNSNVSWLVTPKVAATWNTQAKYNALIGDRVLIDLTAGVFTALAADGANNGCVVEPLDILRYPNKVRLSFRKGLNYLA